MFKSKRGLFKALTLAITICLLFSALSTSFAAQPVKDPNSFYGKAPKYIFLFIGDGMGFPQIDGTQMYLGKDGTSKQTPVYGKSGLGFVNFPVTGVSTTYDSSSFIPDSASAGTAIATGNKTYSGVLGMDTTKTVKYPNFSEYVKSLGYKVGIISSVSIDHATPASFYAHQPSRSNYYDIGVELAKSNFDYFGGGGFLQPTGSKKDKASVLDIAKANGFKVLTAKNDILNASSKSGKVIATNPTLDTSFAMPYEIDRKSDDLSLADYVRKGIDVLDNPNGFFMMCEGGKIDWTCHANDAGTAMQDVIALDNAIAEARKFYDQHPDETLIVVTADHETGGMTLGYAGTKYNTGFKLISSYQKMSYDVFAASISKPYAASHKDGGAKLEDLYPSIKANFGLVPSNDPDAAARKDMVLTSYEIQKLRDALSKSVEAANGKFDSNDTNNLLQYYSYDPLTVTVTHILNNKAGIAFTSYEHTAVPVPVYAKGIGQELFAGYYDDTDIFKKLISIAGLDRDKTITVKVGKEAEDAQMDKGILMLPLQSVVSELGGTIDKTESDGKYIVKLQNGNQIEFYLDQKDLVLNGGTYTLSAAPMSNGSVIMVPKDLLEYAGCSLAVTEETIGGGIKRATVVINYK